MSWYNSFLLSVACHPSCGGSCLNETVEGCIGSCKEGWKKDQNSICVDIDECSLKLHNCKLDQYCLNEPGRFSCNDCPKCCLTCSATDPDKCTVCKHGYVKTEDGRCTDIDECLEGKHDCLPMTYCLNKAGGFSCNKCNQACAKGCEGPLIEDCFDCKDGYRKNENGTGCIDINECVEYPNICQQGKYCLNKKGSYSCKNCDEACHICFGPGPHSCLSCSQGHTFIKRVCRDASRIKEIEIGEDEDDL
ncbi:hypothetical protein MXB_5464 [Myxobolus squamalis]|nr:hypothetical protein MXB_5464 [Myxobolus squamalis]